MSHRTDPELKKRLKRAEGHLSSVLRMVEEGRDALLLAQQLQAVIKALEKSKQMLILDHIDHHLADLPGPRPHGMDEAVAQLREIARYL
ncbi:metal-sensing transcriptional repressor [Aurantimonas sp. Leaf443]|uniref:metal-sensing transcriptional repressor n=1 Tax=Aurantimonas sp. Leaf443 TaxID=1736378 RepID=UPI0006F2F26B|nr:metal-sensing transcriptional repressor [Aurantimonas sp. Leaf443]KQT86196.1 nickel resistance protein [Aurantimonas sp. Leaf443]